MKLVDKLAHEYARQRLPWIDEDITKAPTHELMYTNIIDDYNEGFKKALELAAEKAECEFGAVVDFGNEQISASVDKKSILNIINADD